MHSPLTQCTHHWLNAFITESDDHNLASMHMLARLLSTQQTCIAVAINANKMSLRMIALRSGECPYNCKPLVNVLLFCPGESADSITSEWTGFASAVLVSIVVCMIDLTMLSVSQDAEGDAGGGQVSNLTNSSHKLMRWLRDYGELMRYCIKHVWCVSACVCMCTFVGLFVCLFVSPPHRAVQHVCSIPESNWQQALDANACQQHASQQQAGSSGTSKQGVTDDLRQTYSMQASLIRKGTKRNNSAFRHQLDEEPSTIPGCHGSKPDDGECRILRPAPFAYHGMCDLFEMFMLIAFNTFSEVSIADLLDEQVLLPSVFLCMLCVKSHSMRSS